MTKICIYGSKTKMVFTYILVVSALHFIVLDQK